MKKSILFFIYLCMCVQSLNGQVKDSLSLKTDDKSSEANYFVTPSITEDGRITFVRSAEDYCITPLTGDSHVLRDIHSFDIIPFLVTYEKMDEEKLFEAIVDRLKTIGGVRLTPRKPLFDPLETNPPSADVSVMISIGMDHELSCNMSMHSKVQISSNRCETYCMIWGKKGYALIDPQQERTGQMIKLIEKMINDFESEYIEANPNAQSRPIFEIRNVISSI